MRFFNLERAISRGVRISTEPTLQNLAGRAAEHIDNAAGSIQNGGETQGSGL